MVFLNSNNKLRRQQQTACAGTAGPTCTPLAPDGSRRTLTTQGRRSAGTQHGVGRGRVLLPREQKGLMSLMGPFRAGRRGRFPEVGSGWEAARSLCRQHVRCPERSRTDGQSPRDRDSPWSIQPLCPPGSRSEACDGGGGIGPAQQRTSWGSQLGIDP